MVNTGEIYERDNGRCQFGVKFINRDAFEKGEMLRCENYDITLWKRSIKPLAECTNDDYITVCTRCKEMLTRMVEKEKEFARITGK